MVLWAYSSANGAKGREIESREGNNELKKKKKRFHLDKYLLNVEVFSHRCNVCKSKDVF